MTIERQKLCGHWFKTYDGFFELPDPCPVCDWSEELSCTCDPWGAFLVEDEFVMCPRHRPEDWGRISAMEKTRP